MISEKEFEDLANEFGLYISRSTIGSHIEAKLFSDFSYDENTPTEYFFDDSVFGMNLDPAPNSGMIFVYHKDYRKRFGRKIITDSLRAFIKERIEEVKIGYEKHKKYLKELRKQMIDEIDEIDEI